MAILELVRMYTMYVSAEEWKTVQNVMDHILVEIAKLRKSPSPKVSRQSFINYDIAFIVNSLGRTLTSQLHKCSRREYFHSQIC